MYTASEIIKKHAHILSPLSEKCNPQITKACAPHLAHKNALCFVNTQELLQGALHNNAAMIIVSEDLKAIALSLIKADHTVLVSTQNIPYAMSEILNDFDHKKVRFQQEMAIHPTAAIHPSAKISPNVTIGPFVFIGARTIIEENVIIGASSVIEAGVKIGKNTLIHPLVFVGAETAVGSDCEFHPHVVIGSDGYGYVKDKNKKNKKIPQIGRVRIGDRVELGAHVAIDRAALTETVIEQGTKIDNLCHIAHNCEIGEESLITAGFFTAGSTKIGARFMTGGNSVVADHLTIASDVTLAGRSTVTNDIKTAGAFGGYPLLPIREHLKVLASSVHLVELRKNMAQVLKKLNLTQGD